MERGFAVVGLGYVGLPVALALARKFAPVLGFDIAPRRIAALRAGQDITGEVGKAELADTTLRLTDDPDALAAASFVVVTVPTPIDAERRPDLAPLTNACGLIGPRLKAGTVVVFEFDGLSRAYPRGVRAVARPSLGAEARDRLQARLFARAYQSRRQAAPARNHRQDRRRRGRGDAGADRRDLWPDRRGRLASRLFDRSRRSRESYREYAARPQHRVDERTGDHLRPARHFDPRGVGGGRHEMEFFAVHAGARRRTLHRRRPLLSDRAGRGGGLLPAGDPIRPADQRRHGRLYRPAPR